MTDDQKRALAIGGVGIAALLVVSRLRGGRTAVAPPQPTTGQVAPYTPQAPVIVAAGESVYDPNSQALLTTPASSTDAGVPGTANNTPGLGTQATAPGAPSYAVNVNYPAPVRRQSHAKRATKRKPTRVTRSPAARHAKPSKRTPTKK